MSRHLRKRLDAIAATIPPPARTRVDLSVFSDAELERLAGYAERRLAWSGDLDAWWRDGLTDTERADLTALEAIRNASPE